MLRVRRLALLASCFAVLLAGCSAVATPSAPTPLPTVAPTATPEPTVAAGTTVVGIDLGGLTIDQAEQRLRSEVAASLPTVLTVTIDGSEVDLPLSDLSFSFELEAAVAALRSGSRLPEPLFTFDASALRTAIGSWADRFHQPPTLTVEPVEGFDRRRGFVAVPGRVLDRAALERELTDRLAAGDISEPIEVELTADPAAPVASDAELLAALEELAAEWEGVVGVYVYDLVTGTETLLNARSVFSGASTLKTPIMLYAYTNVAEFDQRQLSNLRRAIIDSDNLSANEMLAAGAGGSGTDDAMVGAVEMTQMLADLGLENLYLTVPYESGDYIRLYNLSYPCGPRDPVGEPPYTETGCALRSTPYAMGQVYLMIEACADGEGPLLERFDLMSPERCTEMLDLLAQNGDNTRMVAGIPDGVRVEHKSGWIEDMQADVGIVRSPNGDYMASIYVYKPLNGEYSWPDSLMAPMVADVSYLIYSAFNPTVVTP